VINNYSSYTLYERSGCYSDGSAYPLTACNAALTNANLKAEWQNYYGFVAWWAHGSATGASRITWANDAYDPPGAPGPYDYITQRPGETQWSTMWSSSDCPSLSDAHPSFVVQVSCTNGDPTQSNNLGYSLLKCGAIDTISASAISWYGVGSWSTSTGIGYGDNASYGFYVFSRMAGFGERVGEALNYCKKNFGMGWGWNSWMNCLDFNIYGAPDSGLPRGAMRIRNSSGNAVAAIDTAGNLALAGSITQSTPPAGTSGNEFMVKNNVGTLVAKIDGQGNLALAGTVHPNQGTLSPPAGAFVVKDGGGSAVAYFTNTGHLYLAGRIYGGL